MSQLKQSTARDKMIFMTDSADHVTGKTGLTLTLTLSKNGGAFASISPTVTERGNGWYSLALTSSHTDTLGDLALHVTATGADPADIAWQVLAGLPGETVTLSPGTHTGAVIPTVTTLTGHTPQTGDAYARLGAPSGASVSADVAAIQSDTNDIQSRLPAALVGGKMDAVATVTSDVNISTTSISAIWAYVVTGAFTAVQLMRGFAAVLMGESSGHESGTPKYRDLDDTKNVIDAITDANGNRTSVTKDLS